MPSRKIEAPRIHRLKEVISGAPFNGNQAEFARAISRKPAQVYQWLNDLRPITEKSARHIEGCLGKPPYWMDGELRAASPAQAIRDEAALDGYALIEQGLRALVVVGKTKDAILTQVRDAAEESKQYREIALAEFTQSQVKPDGNEL